MKLIFLGCAGSGKGTQAALLSKKLGVPHISMGDLLRSLEGDLKQEVDNIINQGNMVSNELTLKILKQRLDKPDAQLGFILDGFPRNLEQAGLLKDVTDIDKVIFIDLSDEEAINRISGRVHCENCNANYNTLTEPKPIQDGICNKCGWRLVSRKDDNEGAVKKRLEFYHQNTKPLLEFYQDKLIKINGGQSIEDMNEEVNEKLN